MIMKIETYGREGNLADKMHWKSRAMLDRLEQLEVVIKKGLPAFVSVGLALKEINEKKLYKNYASTFDEYMQIRLGLSARQGYYLIAGARTAITVDDYGDDDPVKISANSCSQSNVIIDNENKARALRGLDPNHKRIAARDAYDKALKDGRSLTAEDIEEEAKQYRIPKKKKLTELEKEHEKIMEGLDKISIDMMNMVKQYPLCQLKQEAVETYIHKIEEMLEYLRKNRCEWVDSCKKDIPESEQVVS